jgi:hypothetical protein
MAQSVLELTQAPEFKRRLRERLAEIAVENERLGLPKAVVIDDVVYRRFPDGRSELVDTRTTSDGATERDSS